MTETNDQRIAREEAKWDAPRLFVLAFGFLAVAIAFIYAIASL